MMMAETCCFDIVFKNIHPLFHMSFVFDCPATYLVVEVMHDDSRMMSKEVSTVIYSCLYTMYVYLCNIYQCNLYYSTCRLL